MSSLKLLSAYLEWGELTIYDLSDDDLILLVNSDDGLDVRSLSDEELIAIVEGSDD